MLLDFLGDVATIVTGSEYAFYLIVILILLIYALGKIILMGAFSAIVLGLIGYAIAGENGATIGAILGLIVGVLNAIEELKTQWND